MPIFLTSQSHRATSRARGRHARARGRQKWRHNQFSQFGYQVRCYGPISKTTWSIFFIFDRQIDMAMNDKQAKIRNNRFNINGTGRFLSNTMATVWLPWKPMSLAPAGSHPWRFWWVWSRSVHKRPRRCGTDGRTDGQIQIIVWLAPWPPMGVLSMGLEHCHKGKSGVALPSFYLQKPSSLTGGQGLSCPRWHRQLSYIYWIVIVSYCSWVCCQFVFVRHLLSGFLKLLGGQMPLKHSAKKFLPFFLNWILRSEEKLFWGVHVWESGRKPIGKVLVQRK